MECLLYPNTGQFLDELEPLLLKEEACNQLILRNAYRLKDPHVMIEHFCGYMKIDGKIALIFLYMHPYNLLVDDLVALDDASMNFFAKYIINQKAKIPGINASSRFASSFAKTYHMISGLNYECRLKMDIMVLTKLNEIHVTPGFFRSARMDDLNLVNDWALKFQIEAVHQQADLKEIDKANRLRIDDGRLFIFENEMKIPVSIGQYSGIYPNGVSLSLIYTDQNQRGLGYGIAITYYLSKQAFERGSSYVTLFVDQKNPISNRVYEKIGFSIVKDNYDYRFIE
jgi:predicted GNAT family acetyltransferase